MKINKNYTSIFTSSAALAAASMIGTTQAASVIIGNWDSNNTSSHANFTISVAADGNDWVYSWTRTGNLDGLGNTADTLSFDLRSSAFTGSSFDTVSGDLTLGTSHDYTLGGTVTTPGQHFGPGGDVDNNQSFQLSIENIVYTSGDGGSETAVFNGFSGISVYANPGGNNTYYFGTTGAEVLVPAASPVSFTTTDVLTVTSAQAGERFRDTDFSFEVEVVPIPEPSSAALLGIGLGAFVLRRRRA